MSPVLLNPSRFGGGGGGGGGYAAAVAADSPAAWYRLGDASGTTMTDSSGSSRNGTYANVTLGTAGLVTGDANTAATFNGTTSTGITAYASWMNVSSALTVEGIVKMTSVTGAHPIIDRDHSGLGRVFLFRINNGKLELITSGGAVGVVFCTGTTTLSTGVKYHLAGTYDGSNLRIYINGTLEKTTAASGALNTGSSSPLTVGCSYSGTTSIANFSNGIVDEAAYYTTALSGARIAAHAAAA